ncbi:arginyl-tRNA synthetase [Amphibacillus marinus]|uniref:Arginine--tRNA ligase n=1 Tax=Amphibacillus marinus TaxID=872970 RepID=A0A1H8LSY9_9BACI|nr:arginine--tRNA ligase [Amphibacillus marinus]SEO07978.1 arginyl-tRNA synthetase [Amphibacillus marinus]
MYEGLLARRIIALFNLTITEAEIMSLIEQPKFQSQGDLAFPCFRLAKLLKQSPNQIALKLSKEIQEASFESVEASGPYLNVFLNKKLVSNSVLTNILLNRSAYGAHQFGNNKTFVIDFSSPNIAKPFSMGHLRSTVIGNSLAKIAEKCGYKVVKINYLGDWGTQFGKLICAYKRWGDEQQVREAPIKNLLNLYVKFHKEAEADSQLDDQGREWFKKLEDNDSEATVLWQWFRKESLHAFNHVYNLLNVSFDSFNGEAFYNDKMAETIRWLKAKGLVVESAGAEVVRLDESALPPCLLKKKDGATLYATRDITAARDRYHNYQFSKAVYVVGHEQSLHFNQVFTVLAKAGVNWAQKMEHVPFGFILKDGKKMSTRKGKVVLLEDVINDAIKLAEHNINVKNPSLPNKQQVAHQVGIGAMIFHDLKHYRLHNVEFSLDEMLRFEGTTGPYVQYTHARAQSIITKAELLSEDGFMQGLCDTWSWPVIKHLTAFPDKVESAFHENDPSQIARYLISLSQAFNKYYANVKVLTADDQLGARIALVNAVTIVLQEGLRLLGIAAPDKM